MIGNPKTYSCLLFLVASTATAQSTLVHSISASTGISVPVGIFADDSDGEGHGFADPGFAAQVLFEVGDSESKISFLGGMNVLSNSLDKEHLAALYPPGITIEAKRYNLYGISAGMALNLSKTKSFSWQLRGTVGIATISYPAHELWLVTANQTRLIYRSSANNSTKLTGSIGLNVQRRLSSRLRINGQADFFRSRAHHVITYYVPGVIPPTNEEDTRQQIAMVNIQIGMSYSF